LWRLAEVIFQDRKIAGDASRRRRSPEKMVMKRKRIPSTADSPNDLGGGVRIGLSLYFLARI
jgi:hypothetical protein